MRTAGHAVSPTHGIGNTYYNRTAGHAVSPKLAYRDKLERREVGPRLFGGLNNLSIFLSLREVALEKFEETLR